MFNAILPGVYRRLRQLSGLSTREMSRRLKVTRQTLSHYENGKTRPDVAREERLADVAGCTPVELVAAFCEQLSELVDQPVGIVEVPRPALERAHELRHEQFLWLPEELLRALDDQIETLQLVELTRERLTRRLEVLIQRGEQAVASARRGSAEVAGTSVDSTVAEMAGTSAGTSAAEVAGTSVGVAAEVAGTSVGVAAEVAGTSENTSAEVAGTFVGAVGGSAEVAGTSVGAAEVAGTSENTSAEVAGTSVSSFAEVAGTSAAEVAGTAREVSLPAPWAPQDRPVAGLFSIDGEPGRRNAGGVATGRRQKGPTP